MLCERGQLLLSLAASRVRAGTPAGLSMLVKSTCGRIH